MASGFNLKEEQHITKLKKVKELVPQRSEYFSPSSGCETWRCAFSPDELIFGWSSGNRVVTLVPSSLLATALSQGEETVVGNQIVIDCGFLVRSLTFASIENLQKSATFWPRSAHRKDLFLVTGHYTGRVRVWDVVAGRLLLELLDHKDMVSDLAIVPKSNGLLVSTSFDGTIKIWDLIDEGNLIKTLKIDGKSVYACSWSPDGSSLVTVGMNKIVHVWDMKTISVRLLLRGHQHNVVACDFSPDSCLIATASWDTRVIIWDASNGNILKEFFHLRPPPRLIYASGENGSWIRSVSFSPDGAHLATVSDDGLVRVWDLSTDYPEAVGCVEQGLCCTYSPRGHYLAIGTKTGTVTFFEPKSCVKPLLFLCRSAIRRVPELSTQFEKKSIPTNLIDYLLYKELY